jgi:hypothetical protein
VDLGLDVQAGGFVAIELAGPGHQALGQSGEEPPVPSLVGVREGAAANRMAESQMADGGGPGAAAGLDVAQILPIGQRREHHRREMLPG